MSARRLAILSEVRRGFLQYHATVGRDRVSD